MLKQKESLYYKGANMKLDMADKFLLEQYYKNKKNLFPNEIDYCEKLIKKIILKIAKNDLIKEL